MTVDANKREMQTAPKAKDAARSLGFFVDSTVPRVQPDSACVGESKLDSVNLGEKTVRFTWSPFSPRRDQFLWAMSSFGETGCIQGI